MAAAAEVGAELTWAELINLGLTAQEIAQADVAIVYQEALATQISQRAIAASAGLFDYPGAFTAAYTAPITVGTGALSTFELAAEAATGLGALAVGVGSIFVAWDAWSHIRDNKPQVGRDPASKPYSPSSTSAGYPVYYQPNTGVIRESQWLSLERRGLRARRSRRKRRERK